MELSREIAEDFKLINYNFGKILDQQAYRVKLDKGVREDVRDLRRRQEDFDDRIDSLRRSDAWSKVRYEKQIFDLEEDMREMLKTLHIVGDILHELNEDLANGVGFEDFRRSIRSFERQMKRMPPAQSSVSKPQTGKATCRVACDPNAESKRSYLGIEKDK